MPLPTGTVSHNGMQSLFSVEQVELIRRLRNSGITKEQVVQAFESFERIDDDLGMLYTIPKSLAQINKSSSLYTCQTTAASSSTVDQTLLNEHGRKRRHSNSEVANTVAWEEGEVTANSASRLDSIVEIDGDEDNDVECLKQNKRSRHEEMVNNAIKSGSSTSFFNTFFSGKHSKLPEKLQQQMYIWYLKQQGMSANFYYSQSGEARHHLQQQQQDEQAETCSLQSSESQNSVPEQHVLYGLPSSRLHHIGSVNQAIHAMLSPGSAADHTGAGQHRDVIIDDQRAVFSMENQMMIKSDEYADMQYAPRRERFTFREKHLEILEAYFKLNQYPINDERELIANKCNAAMTISTGRELDEKERVTNQNVQNWFNNRRKEIKKLARAEGINCSEVSLPSRLKPRTDFSEIISVGDQPWSYEDRNGTERSFNSFGVTNTNNIKSEPCLSPDGLHKPQNQPTASLVSSNQKSPNRPSASVPFNQSQTKSPTVSQSPMTLMKNAQKIKQETFENMSNDLETTT